MPGPRAFSSLVLLLLLASALPVLPVQAAGCPPLREPWPPRLVRDGTVWWLHRTLDPEWLACNRKAGGRLSGRSEVERGGSWELDSETSDLGARIRLGAWASNYCGRSGKSDPQRVRFTVTGKGALAEASWTSAPLPALCGCSRSPDGVLEVKAGPGRLAVSGKVDPAFLACAGAAGGEFEVRAYVGADEREAAAQVLPAAVLAGLSGKATFSGVLPLAALCRAGARVATVELAGRGGLAALTGEGRTSVPLDCGGRTTK